MSRRTPTKDSVGVPAIGLRALFVAYLQIGITAFGFTMLQKITQLVVHKKGWLTQEEADHGLALVQLYPGPIMVDFTVYVGYRLRGVKGALATVSGFVLPSLVLMIALSALYFALGSLAVVHALFIGLDALVVGVVLNLTLDFGQRYLKGAVQATLAVIAFALLSFGWSALIALLVALLVGALLLRPKGETAAAALPGPRRRQASQGLRLWLPIAATVAVVVGAAVVVALLHTAVSAMTLSFFKIGSVAFGNGMTIMPLLQADAVNHYHWLTNAQFADGIALGQVTPGPFLITAAFVGYKLGGVWAAVLATFAIFAPSFAMTLVFSEVFEHLHSLAWVRGALSGILASFVGLLAVVTLQLASVTGGKAGLLTLAAAAFVAVRFFKLDVLWVFGGGLGLWALLHAFGLA